MASSTEAAVGDRLGGELLAVERLNISFRTGSGHLVDAVTDLDLHIGPGEVVGVVGESGCGKSVTAQAIMGLLPVTASVQGAIRFRGQDLVGSSERQLRRIRGADIGMIFQEPMTALDPTLSIGAQLAETVRAHRDVGRREARDLSIEALRRVGIPSPRERLKAYPHQLSGGMRQRVVIAIAMICGPALLIADEPTTALDVTIQSQVLDLIRNLVDVDGVSVMLITHDLGVVARVCDRVVTLYAGEVVETAPVNSMVTDPAHPYTSGLLRSIPVIGGDPDRLRGIPGRVPADVRSIAGCRFADRCDLAELQCREQQQFLTSIETERSVRCWKSAVGRSVREVASA